METKASYYTTQIAGILEEATTETNITVQFSAVGSTKKMNISGSQLVKMLGILNKGEN